MDKKLNKANQNKGNDQHKVLATAERAIGDGAWRSRPTWRAFQRPDRQWSPTLTVEARAALEAHRGCAHD